MENNSATILVVDEEALNRDMLSRRLKRHGYQVLEAVDGYAALGMLEIETVNVVLLDIMIPGISGLEVLRKIRETRTESQLPFIMASALNDTETIVKSLNQGANDYVTKPVDFPIVLARIEAQLRNRVITAPAQTARDEIRPGATLGGRYLLIDLIGEGGFGMVYRARHTELELELAVKLLHDNITHNPALRERFRREGMSMCRIQHPNAVKIYDFQSTDGGATYLVMELLHGCSLGEYLVQHPALTIERCAEILMPVCELLSVAHDAGVVHRDIKPDNLFLEKVTGRETTRVLDFGIAELLDESTENLTQAGMIVGSPKYLAPERLLGDEVDSHSDIFSLGVVLYQMINGSLPFPAKNLQDRLSSMKDSDLLPMSDQVPVAITELITSALSLDPAARLDALKFAAAMMDFLPVGYHSDRHSRQLPTVSPESEVSAFPESAPQAIDPTIVVRSDRVLASAISPPPSHQQGNHSDSENPPLINILLVEDNEMNENKVNKPPIRESGQVSQL